MTMKTLNQPTRLSRMNGSTPEPNKLGMYGNTSRRNSVNRDKNPQSATKFTGAKVSANVVDQGRFYLQAS